MTPLVTRLSWNVLPTVGFFLMIAVYLCALGLVGQPSVHPYFDRIGIRDAGTTLSYYASGQSPLKAVFVQAMLHYEGPLQYIILNAYCFLVGDLFPLNPATMQFPNTVFAFLATMFAYLLGKRLIDARFGICCALAFALAAWLGETIRMPWYFNTMSCTLHFSTFYYFVSLMEMPKSRKYQAAAAGSLALYLLTGMDWPAFGLSFGVFVLLSGRLRIVLLNPFNVAPLAVALLQVTWPAALYFAGREDLAPGTMLLYPFLRYTDLAANPDFAPRVFNHVLSAWGPHLVVALAGFALYGFRQRRLMSELRIQRSLFDATCLWFFVAGYGLVSSSTSITYLYVAAMPTALLAGLALWKMRNAWVGAIAIVMAVFQVYITSGKDFSFDREDDRRILAAASFLIEQRPDLLTENKTAFLPRNAASDVGQYARGRNNRIVMPRDFPVERRKHSVGSPEDTLISIVDAYNANGEIRADWVLLDSELFGAAVKARDFYLRLLNDPSVKWIAQFQDTTGHNLYIGEVAIGQGTSFDKAPILDTEALSRAYETKYDRIGFLKHNVEYVDHY